MNDLECQKKKHYKGDKLPNQNEANELLWRYVISSLNMNIIAALLLTDSLSFKFN